MVRLVIDRFHQRQLLRANLLRDLLEHLGARCLVRQLGDHDGAVFSDQRARNRSVPLPVV